MANAPKALPTARDMALVAIIEQEAAAQGLTQDALAARVGIHQSQVSRILNGVRPVTLTEMLAMCEALGVTLEDVAKRAAV